MVGKKDGRGANIKGQGGGGQTHLLESKAVLSSEAFVGLQRHS